MAEAATILEAPPAVKLASLDLRRSAMAMGEQEARYLVDLYYQMQEYRKRSANQCLAIGDEEPHALIAWSTETFETVEKSIKSALGSYAQAQRPGEWAMSIHGIGPVIAAGLLAHINVNPWKCVTKTARTDGCTPEQPHEDTGCGRIVVRTSGGVWAFAGLDPNAVWEKGTVRPWNARLKVLAWKIGESFMKQRNMKVDGVTMPHTKDFYGKRYVIDKAKRVKKNEAGGFAELAARALTEQKIKNKKLRATYEAGRLPDGRIQLQAQRCAAKLFLSHYFEVAYECKFGERAPGPYSIEQQKRAHYIAPPNWSRLA